jgi:hypothetical protein
VRCFGVFRRVSFVPKKENLDKVFENCHRVLIFAPLLRAVCALLIEDP